MTGRRFALVDRDGTINEEVDHLEDPDELVLIPGSAAALGQLRAIGLGIVVVTNQAQIGRGLLTEERLAEIHDRLVAMLAAEGAEVDAILHCPHAPEDGCNCRKPRTGMARDAAARFGSDPAEAYVVGDHASDMAMGRAIGATTFLVLTGHGVEERPNAGEDADHVVADLAAAVDIIAASIGREATA
ncbi:MAG: D-glycero-alpha-D-manno-heptose-1,7-bisphosphate 7-phosphatase [Actinomycetota bacterium]